MLAGDDWETSESRAPSYINPFLMRYTYSLLFQQIYYDELPKNPPTSGCCVLWQGY